MSKVIRFAYDSEESEGYGEYPEKSIVKAQHYFEECITWVPILWQFCKFLESTGYVGITEKVVIRDPYGIESDSTLFDTIGPDEYIMKTKPLDNQDEDAQ